MLVSVAIKVRNLMTAENCMVRCANCGGRMILENSGPKENRTSTVESMVSMRMLGIVIWMQSRPNDACIW